MTRPQVGYRARCYADRQCQRCHRIFTPRSGNARNCDQCCDPRHRSTLPPRQAPRPAKPLIGATAPDFLRALPMLRAELERVSGHRYDVRPPEKH